MKQHNFFLQKIWAFVSASEYAVLFFCVVLSFGLFHLTFQARDEMLFIGSKAWSDFGAHIPLIRSFSLGDNWPPEYPLFAGEPIRYHFLFYAAVGLLERAGLNLGLALNGLSALGLGLLLWMLYRVAKLIFNSKLAGWLAIWFGLLNSSLSAVIFAEHSGLSWFAISDWPALLTAALNQTKFASFGPWDGNTVSAFWSLNIFTNQRHLGLSMGLVWWVIWPLLVLWWTPESIPKKNSVNDRVTFGLRMLVMAVFPLLHQAGAILTAGMTVFLLGLSLLTAKTRSQLHRLLVGSYILGLALMGLVLTSFVPASHEAPQIVMGFLSGSTTPFGLLSYWWWNLGIGLVVWLAGLFLPHRGRTLLWLVTPFFIAANLWQFSPDMINNHKFVNFFIEGITIIAAGWFTAGWQLCSSLFMTLQQPKTDRALLALPVMAIVFAFTFLFGLSMSLSGLVDVAPILNDQRYEMQDWQKRPVSVWLKENTPPDATLLTTTYFYHPASLVGRKLYLDYGYFAWSLGYQDAERRLKLMELFGDFQTVTEWCQRLQQEKIDAVVLSPGNGDLGQAISVSTSFMAQQLSPTIVTDDGYTIYQLSRYCR